MKKRIISACVLIPVVVACFLISPVTRALLLLAAAVLAVWEMSRALGKADMRCPAYTLYMYVAAAALFLYFRLDRVYSEALFFAALLSVLTLGVVDRRIGARGSVAGLFVLVYPTIPFLLILSFALSESWIPVFLIGCVSAWVCDSFALFGGKRFGKHKLCPEVSPNKTIEGTLCGALASAVAGIGFYFALRSGFGITLSRCVLTAFICSSFGQVGDLAASLIKRMTGVKDYSNLIPGHGGVMDRGDSLLFSIPVAYFCLVII